MITIINEKDLEKKKEKLSSIGEYTLNHIGSHLLPRDNNTAVFFILNDSISLLYLDTCLIKKYYGFCPEVLIVMTSKEMKRWITRLIHIENKYRYTRNGHRDVCVDDL